MPVRRDGVLAAFLQALSTCEGVFFVDVNRQYGTRQLESKKFFPTTEDTSTLITWLPR
jgi:hypothetical protein